MNQMHKKKQLKLNLRYSGQMLLCVFGSFLPLAAAHATLTTYIDQTFTGTINISSVGQNGVNGNGQNYIPQPGQPGAPITLQFNQSAGGLGNTINSYGDGIFATSTGGKGGDAYTYRGTSELDGGPGAGGGVGGVIEITNTGKFIVNATGDEAHGIYATSQGGVGSPASGRSSGGGDPGGTGGSGKNVTVILNNGAAISSTGQLSNGVLAQSLGDVAGNGNLTAQNTPSMKDPYPNGSVGGYSGDVVVQLNEGASILTSGANSNGIVAINRGSAGGQGASIEIVFGSGTAGNGGSGGDSGVTTVTSSGSIKTTGNASMGMVVQSSGGNGGYGGDASGNGGMTAGQAGGPGKAGVINITNSGSITTMGTYAPGILAQSFAGSGGVGGTASGSLFYDQGGGASASTNGGTVNINLAGDLTTKGDNSQAIVAQSIGGKGGMGGEAGGMIYVKGGDGSVGGSGGMINVTTLAASDLHINTQGQSAHGVVAQAVGGSGGMGGAANADGVNLASAIGGQAGAGGNGGNTAVNLSGSTSDATPGILTTGSGAFGILSQSIGGGGGAGGGAYTVSAGMLADVAFAVGGAGGDGGAGGSADATLRGFNLQTGLPSAQNTTLAADSIGVAVQSIGGGGGQGGSGAASAYAIAVPGSEDPEANITFSGAFAVGGVGGKGGNGGSATASVLDGSSVSTYSDGSLGVKIQSIGGGGGHGGDSSALAASIGYGVKNRYIKAINPQTNAVNLSMSVGGAGGNGGNGASASLVGLGTNNAKTDPVTLVSTNGEEATAVLVQSIGGGGGNAGTGNAKVQSYATSQNLDLSISVGATGGSGGDGGTVYALIDNTGHIVTQGNGSKGLVAQSIGGGGGTGTGSSLDLTGLNDWVTAVTGMSSSVQTKLLHDRHITVGAQGGVGGNGGLVTVEHNAYANIQTSGVDAPGMVLQSIGGGGGLGGSAAINAKASGTGPQSVLAQLGDDGIGVSVSVNSTLSVGGANGSSGNGGEVNAQSYGKITTLGDHSPGIMAQSVGAGGGRAAIAASGVEVNAQLSNSLRSIGGALLLGNDVNLGYTIGETYTIAYGENINFGNGGTALVNLNGSAITTGQSSQPSAITNNGFQSFGVLAQSVGGGGGVVIDGTPGVQAAAALGAASGQNFYLNALSPSYALMSFGNGGAVSINAINGQSAGNVTTYGDAAHGVFLQSVGGGGGVFGAGSSQMNRGGGDGRTVTVGLGGGVNYNINSAVNFYGGDGGEITAPFNEKAVTINTSGHGAFGLFAQSVGGGGGTVAVAPGVATQILYFGSGASLQESGTNYSNSTGGNGGAVAINISNASSNIVTQGVGAHGIMAQSVGGGGGLVGNYRSGVLPVMSESFPTVFSGGSSGNGGDINMAVSGQVATGGLGAMGIVAQSIGGGGGWMANEASVFAGSSPYLVSEVSAGKGGNININLPETTITTLSDNSAAVWAQSVGPNGNGTMTINVGTDTTHSYLSGGSNQSPSDINGGVGIMLLGGQNNQVNIAQNSTVTAKSGVAIKGSYHVLNSGQVVGSLLGASSSATPISLLNYGTLSNAEMVQGDVVNHGHVFVAQSQAQGATHITGNFTQSDQGTLQVSADFVGQSADMLQVDGHAKLDGNIKINAKTLMPNQELAFLQAGSITSKTELQGESDLFAYQSRQLSNTLNVSVESAKINELSASHGVGSNLQALGSHLQEVWDRGSKSELGTLYAALNRSAALGGESYASALSDLSPGVLAAPAALKQASMMSFSNSLMSCPAFEGAQTQMTERDCTWGRIIGNTSKLDASLGTSGLKSQSVMYQMGTQRNIAPNWFVGVAGAYEHQKIRSDDPRQRISGDSGYLGVSLKYESGPWTLAGALTGSYSSFDNTRRVALMSAEAKSRSHVMSISQRLRASYTHAMPQSYIKPYIDVDVAHTRMPSFEERGAGALNLRVQSSNKWSVVVSPAVEFGGRFELKNGYTVRPYTSVGVALSSTGKFDTRARLSSAPVGTAHFSSTLETGRVLGLLSGGVHVLSNKGMDVRLQYDGQLSNKIRSHSGSIKASWSF